MRAITRVPLCVLVLAAACADSPTQPEAGRAAMLVASTAKAGKIDICHYDEDLDRYFAKSIPASAWEDHQAHGDGMVGDPVPAPHAAGYVFDENCQPVEAEPVETIYAVAYVDVVDDGGGYDPDTDYLIAKLVEASGDGLPGNGDKVITHVYPTAFDAPWGIQSFNKTEHTVTSCPTVSPTGIICLNVGLGQAFDFIFGSDFERYREFQDGIGSSEFYDGFISNLYDWVIPNPVSPSNPSQFTNEMRYVGNDDAFLDIEIHLPGT